MTTESPDGLTDAVLPAPLAGASMLPGPAVIGPYQLLRLIGEGGMGQVWLAEQQQPVHRRVALKLIKAGMDTREVVARFESERQALALMDHPAIAKVFDAGSTPEGRPYFVMEYVDGLPINQYCDRHRLTMRQRMELFIQVCEGVQHAHQKAIIHRDLKPSNILVTEIDGRPAPRIIDFGVAKATSQPVDAATMVTQLGAPIGTIGYMSPEQAGSGEDIDTRSDVYSLGVVLYELMVGALPLDLKKLAADEALRRLRDQDAPPPSTRLRLLGGDSTFTAQNRATDLPTLTRQLKGDPDAIVLKALEKDRARRYGTPSELAADIGRYLRNEPVQARPPSRTYQLRKLAQRNRALVFSAAAILIVLLGATVISTREAIRAVRAERSAAASLKQSQEETAKAQAVNSFLQDMLQSADPHSVSKTDAAAGRDVSVAQVLDQAVRRLDAGSLRSQPLVEAAVRESLGITFAGLGRYPEGEKQYRAALALRRSAPGNHNDEVATSEARLAELLTYEDKLSEAETLQRDSLRLRTQLFGADDPVTGASLTGLAVTLQREGKLPQAEAAMREGLAIDLKNNRANDAASDEHNLGVILRLEKRSADAEAMFRRSLATQLPIDGLETSNAATTLNQLAYVLHDEGKLPEAEEYTRRSLATLRHLEGEEHPDIAVGLNSLATILRDEGKAAEAEAMFRQAAAIGLRAWGQDQADEARIETNLGDLLARRGQLQESERLLRAALRSREKVLPPNHPDIFDGEAKLGAVLVQERRYAEAEPLLLSAYRGLESVPMAKSAAKRLAVQKIVEMYTGWSQSAHDKAKEAAKWKAVAESR